MTGLTRNARPLAVQIVERDLLATLDPLGRPGRWWLAMLIGVCGAALVAWIVQLRLGLSVTGMRNYVSWGVYMANFVFFIGISHAGTLISAILRVTDANWRRPITRMAEAITVFALMVGAPMVIIDMGRPERVLNVIEHGRLQSPILWDVVSITTYLTGSMLYLYVAMIPDMPILARRARERGARGLEWMYAALSLGFRDTPQQRRRLGLALGAMAVIIIPVAVSVHTVVSWVFGMTLRPGWHSTIFGPYFVIGAIFSGTAAIITAMALFRRAYRLERYLRPEHFRYLAKLLLVLALLYAYFTLSEYLTAWYGGLESDGRLLKLLAGRNPYGASFWLWVVLGLFAPIALLMFPSRRSLGAIVTASILINIGMWLKRYLIVVPTLLTPYIPAEAADVHPRYFPSGVEWLITAGAFTTFLLLFTVFSRIFPILSIWETAEDVSEKDVQTSATSAWRSTRPASATSVLALLAAGLTALALATPSRALMAQERASVELEVPTATRVELTRTNEDGEDVLVATVMARGRPVTGAVVGFFVQRAFGALNIGQDETLDDGTAAVAFPADLPGDRDGDLRVRALVLAPGKNAGAGVEQVFLGKPAPTPAAAPRALWSSRAPLGLLGGISFLLLCVWTTYAFVVRQLVAIHRLAKEE